MQKVNWDTYKFHCSSLPTLMTQPREKAKKEAGELSETTKTALREIWIEETFGRKKFDTSNKFTEKGLLCEQDSLELVTSVYKRGFLAKNKDFLVNRYVCGTPDVLKPILIDIKTSWDIWTFAKVDEKKAKSDYFWQLLGYMWLLGRKRSKLIYALVNTPEDIKEKELYNLTFKNITPEEQIKAEANYCFDDIPCKHRVKMYNFKFEMEKIQELKRTLDASRAYLKTIKL